MWLCRAKRCWQFKVRENLISPGNKRKNTSERNFEEILRKYQRKSKKSVRFVIKFGRKKSCSLRVFTWFSRNISRDSELPRFRRNFQSVLWDFLRHLRHRLEQHFYIVFTSAKDFHNFRSTNRTRGLCFAYKFNYWWVIKTFWL